MRESDMCVILNSLGISVADGFVHFYENDEVEIRLNDDGDFAANEVLQIISYNQYVGESIYQATVEKYQDKLLFLTNVKHLKTIQKRNNVRVNISYKTKIKQRNNNGKIIHLDTPAEVTVLNLSATGMLINQSINSKDDEPLYEQYQYIFEFTETKVPLSIVFRIVRKKEYFRNIRYGCEFVGLHPKQSDVIYKYLLDLQISQLRGKAKSSD